MLTISDKFKEQVKGGAREFNAEFGEVGGHLFRSDNELISFKIEGNTGFLLTSMRKFTAKVYGAHTLNNKTVNVKFGLNAGEGFDEDNEGVDFY